VNKKKNEQDFLNILREINKDSDLSQRDLAKVIGLSLGKVNYCLNALKNKGYIKIKNFKNSKDKIKYLYVLTPQGITEKTKLTIQFMKRKMAEYDVLKKDLQKKKKEG